MTGLTRYAGMKLLPGRSLTALLTVMALSFGLAGVVDGALPAASAAVVITPHGSARQVYATGLPRGAAVRLVDARGRVVRTQRASGLGAVLFRDVRPGGYRLRVGGTTSPAVKVHREAAAPWDPEIYGQTIPANGYGYLTTRDGTKLAISVHPPTSPATLGVGLPSGVALPDLPVGDYTAPYPTLIEYAGYGYADPKGPQNGIAVLANLMGFAVVDVNMRGTGCSGGAYDFFEPLQQLDAYDVIETVARQPWVKGHKVGMMGISYGGISQLFTAQLNPPSLAAIAPLSTIDSVATTLFPGGIINDGFALAWAKERVHDALPSGPNAGQDYARAQIAAGDRTCAANQAMHSQALDLLGKVRANEHYVPATADPLDPVTFVHRIRVPVFLACQFEDEQTGGHCPALVRHFTGTSKKWFTFTNGAHIDSLDPSTFNRLYDFLEIYVARQAPLVNSAAVRAAAPLIYQQAMGLPSSQLLALPADPIQLQPTLAGAQRAFEALPQVTVDFDNGAGASPTGDRTAGNPYAGYQATFPSLPAPGTRAASWFLQPNGALTSRKARATYAARFRADPRATPLNSYRGNTGSGGLWGNSSQWTYDWRPNPAGTAVSFVTPPLTRDTTVLGAGAVYLWVRSSATDVDLQATVTEVRPDGRETFVQNGWQRASERALAGRKGSLLKQPSTVLEPFPKMTAGSVRAMPKDRFVKVAIPLYYEGHAYRTGSRLRITVSGVNGSQPIWSFAETKPRGKVARIVIGLGRKMPSRLVLPVVPVEVPTALPACHSLRNEPCRTYRPTANATTRVVHRHGRWVPMSGPGHG
jgi:predicted acyl esterase